MNLAISCLMMPHFVFNDLANLRAQVTKHNSLKWFCTLSQNVIDFCPFPIIGSCKTWRNKQQSCHSSSTTKNLPFFVFDCNYIASLATPYAWMRFVDVILCMMMSTSQSSKTLQSTGNMEVKWVIFIGATMVFTLQAQ